MYSKPAQQLKGMIAKMRRVISSRLRKRKWMMVVVNPAAGQGNPNLKAFNRIIHEAGMDWEVEVTNEFGDGARLAARAVSSGAALVAACGGDGTVMDVAAGMLGSDIPLGIIPAGTGNALAKDLGIPLDPLQACSLMVHEKSRIRPIDLGVVDDHLFLLRLGVGLEAEITRTAGRELKDRLGSLAYVAATFQAWSQAPVIKFRLEIDGEIEEVDGLAVMVANAGTLGIPGVSLSPAVRIDDGLLDVFVIRRADLNSLAALAATVTGAPVQQATLPHWQVREVIITADPLSGVEADGEELGNTPVHISVVPGVVKLIVPGK
jgi:diacylglycerol kinase (ATP)